MKAAGLKLLGLVGVAALAVPLCSDPALAIQIGSAPDNPLGITLGLPVGALPPTGLYVNLHPNWGQGDAVNREGDRTGVSSTVFGDFSAFTYVPNFTVLGATYGVAVRGPGVLEPTVRHPGGVTTSGVGLVDWTIAPVILSWALGHGLFFSAEFGFDAPVGTYSATNSVNTGGNHWALEPNIALTYLRYGWDLTAHLTTETAFVNPTTQYTNGTFLFLDLTATKKIGKWTTGPVGFVYAQISPDSGPARLNSGYPTEYSAGWDLGYDLAEGVTINGWFTRDIYTRNTSALDLRAQVNLAWQIF